MACALWERMGFHRNIHGQDVFVMAWLAFNVKDVEG